MNYEKRESALTINGKKTKIRIDDFDKLSEFLNIPEKSKLNIYEKYSNLFQDSINAINSSFLKEELQEKYVQYYSGMMKRLGLA